MQPIDIVNRDYNWLGKLFERLASRQEALLPRPLPRRRLVKDFSYFTGSLTEWPKGPQARDDKTCTAIQGRPRFVPSLRRQRGPEGRKELVQQSVEVARRPWGEPAHHPRLRK